MLFASACFALSHAALVEPLVTVEGDRTHFQVKPFATNVVHVIVMTN
jgi:hypothetical protein